MIWMTHFCSAAGFLHFSIASCPRGSHLCGTLCRCVWENQTAELNFDFQALFMLS